MTRAMHATILLSFCLVPGASTAAGGLEGDLQAVLEGFHQANGQAPGIVVQVVCPRLELDWCGVVGTEDRGSDTPLTCDHTFRIASNTKTYVAASILRLAELGLLDLDDPLARHLGPDRGALLRGDGYDLQAMTLRQVLSHTSGLNEHPADPRYEQAILADPHHLWTPDEQVLRCVEWTDPVAAPGDTFSYSDTGYVLLGGIIESLTGESLGAAVHRLLDFEGLGLPATWWEVMEERPPAAGPRAHQYFGDEDSFGWDPSLDLYGGGGIVCDVGDLGRFMRELLEGKVLKEEASLEAMTSEGTPGYRLGLICTELGGRQAWGHTGFWNTFAFHVPSLDLTVAGCVLDHFAAKGRDLAEKLVTAVDGASAE